MAGMHSGPPTPPFITLFLTHSVHVSWLIVSKRLEEAVRHDALVTVKNKEYLHLLHFKKIYYLYWIYSRRVANNVAICQAWC